MVKTDAQVKIKDAFTELIFEKGLEQMTIADIARTAKINRGTFYLHYIDKADLIYKIEQELIATLIENVNIASAQEIEMPRISSQFSDRQKDNVPLEHLYQTTQNTLGYIKKEKRLLTALLSDQGDSSFFRTFKQAFISDSLREINKQVDLYFKLDGIPLDYAEEVLLSSMTAIVLHWLDKDCMEPIHEVMQMILQLPFFPTEFAIGLGVLPTFND